MSDINIVKDWFRFASNDLLTAKHMFNDFYPRQIEIPCFHCQQCAEKSLKGYLIYRDIEPPKIHDLKVLHRLCIKDDASFDTVISDCSYLNRYGVVSRYPNELETDEASAKAAIEKAKNVYEFCLSKIPEEGGPVR